MEPGVRGPAHRRLRDVEGGLESETDTGVVSTPPPPRRTLVDRDVAPVVARVATPTGRPPQFAVQAAPAVPEDAVVGTADPVTPAPKRSLEDLLGRQLFLKAGVVIVVIGVALFLAFTMAQVGAVGKVAMGYGAGVAMLVLGLATERRDSYRTFGRGILAGAWATLYFVSFAAHFIPAARVIDSPVPAVMLLAATASAAVGFSLRYRREWTTVFAFLLIYVTLAVAAWMHLASFNLLATAICAGAVAALAWRRGWMRLLAVGSTAGWATLALWLLPQLGEWSAAERSAHLLPVCGSLLATWLVLTAAVVERRRGTLDAWTTAAFLANLAGGFGLLATLVQRTSPDHTWLVAAGLGAAYMVASWRLGRRGRDLLYRLAPVAGMVAIAAAVPLKLGLGSGWVPVWLLLVAQLALVAGVLLREAWFRVGGYAALAAVLGVVTGAHLGLIPLTAGWTTDPFRTPVLLAAAFLCLADAYLLRSPWKGALNRGENPVAPMALAAAGTALFLPPIAWEVPRMWIAPALAAIAALWGAAGRREGYRDLLVQATLLAPAAVVVACVLNLDPPAGIPAGIRPLSIGATLALLYAAYALIVGNRNRGRGDVALLTAGERSVAVLYSALGTIGLTLLLWTDVPPVWVAPALSAAVLVHLGLARLYRLPELLAEGAALALAAGVALAAISWDLAGTSLALPARVLSVALTSSLLYGAALLVGRLRAEGAAARTAAASPSVQTALVHPHLLAVLASGLLAIPTFAVAMLVREEALLRGLENGIALAWGGLGLVYLVVGAARSSRVWAGFGAAVMVVATLHLWVANLGLMDPSTPTWLRVGLVGAFLLQLALAYPLLEVAGRRAGDALAASVMRVLLIWLGAITVSWTLAVELPTAWVGASWTALALVLLAAHQLTGRQRWRWPALVTAVAAVSWALVSNVFVGAGPDGPPALALPLACGGLLAGYAVQRIRELMQGDSDRELRASVPRLAWLAGFSALLTGTIAVHAEGTALTVWLSIEGMVLVALGFVMRERLARVAGLSLLSGCVLKLFVYDLRGLTGVPRILSFVVLGLVLIAVSFVYTRFRAGLADYLGTGGGQTQPRGIPSEEQEAGQRPGGRAIDDAWSPADPGPGAADSTV